jgi:hypothetical protein
VQRALLAVSLFVQVTFDLHISPSNPMSFIPVQFYPAESPVWQTNRGDSFQLSPATRAIGLPKYERTRIPGPAAITSTSVIGPTTSNLIGLQRVAMAERESHPTTGP